MDRIPERETIICHCFFFSFSFFFSRSRKEFLPDVGSRSNENCVDAIYVSKRCLISEALAEKSRVARAFILSR